MAVLSASPVVIQGARRYTWRPPLTVSPVAALIVAVVGAFLVTLVLSMTAGRPVAATDVTAVAVPASAETLAYPAWTVQSGDTLWNIARQIRPQADPRAVVLQIQVLNGLTPGHVLQAGEVLQLPAA